MDFLLINKKDRAHNSLIEEYSSSFDVFSKREQFKIAEFDKDDFYLSLYNSKNSKCSFKEYKNGDFIIVLGTLFYKSEFREDCLDNLFRDFAEKDKYISNNLIGNYCVIVYLNGELSIFNDYLGLLRVYSNEDQSIFSTSFLAIARATKNRTLSHQEIFEYIIRGGMYGDKTIFNEINLIPSSTIISIFGERKNEELKYIYERPTFYKDLDKMVDYMTDQLLAIFKVIVQEFDKNITLALTGGYDSRLNLVTLKRINNLPYDLYVYGQDKDGDVLVAKSIADKEHLLLEHINRAHYPNVELNDFPQLVEKNLYYFDGLGNTGIFDNGSDLDTRKNRTKDGKLQLNGGGGEIFRNYWNLNSFGKKALDFSRHKYDIFNYEAFTNLFNKKIYFKQFSEKMVKSVSANSGRLTRKEMEMCYPLFRIKYWQAINNSNNLRFSNTLTPLIDPRLLLPSYDLPMKYKFNGVFEAAMIKKINAKMAKYDSNYGHNFFDKVPNIRKIKAFFLRNIPLVFKPYLRWYSSKSKNTEMPYYLKEEYTSKVIDLDNMIISQFVDLNKLTDKARLSRALTIEYLLKNL